jgi:gas vesicle protein
MSAKAIWIAFGLGVAAGAAVALLYAPQPGVKTRRQLRRNFDDGVDYLEDAASCLKEQAESLSNEARKTFRRTRGQVADVVEKASEAVSGAVKGVHSMMEPALLRRIQFCAVILSEAAHGFIVSG